MANMQFEHKNFLIELTERLIQCKQEGISAGHPAYPEREIQQLEDFSREHGLVYSIFDRPHSRYD